MEKPPAGKVLLDDTVPLTAAIEASQSLQSHTVRGGAGGRPAVGQRGRGWVVPGPGGVWVAAARGRPSPGQGGS